MKTNEFAKMSELVNTVLTRYRNVRKECGISDTAWHSRTIENLAQPYINGYFTLAVVGKVSSGKSTFINALLGCKDLLPTGHDQTTCGITYIEYGEKPEVTITFGDKHTQTITDDIKGKIKQFVAISERFHNLPVNNIDDMILGGYDFEKIWEVHEQLETETLCTKIDEDLLRDYVNHRTKKDIAVEVHIKYPFNEELKGWRIIDTPGIGAIGGIETKTRKLLASQKADGSREVDAIIFLQNGSETLDQTDTKKFVNEQLDNLTESDKHKLFFVLTHSSDTDFLNHKESKLDFIKQNYGDKIQCLTYADSLLYTFLKTCKERDIDLKDRDPKQPEDWNGDEWDSITTILFQAGRHLRKAQESINNETMFRTLEEWAHFDALKDEINTFTKNEKLNNFRDVLNLINTDYRGFRNQLVEDKKTVDGDMSSINTEIEKVKRARTEYSLKARKADEMFKWDAIASKFKFIDEEIEKIKDPQTNTIGKIRTIISNLFDTTQAEERKVFDDIKKDFSDFFSNDSLKDICLEPIDFSAIELEATQQSQETYEISPERVETHFCDDDKRIPATYGTRLDVDKKLENFKTLAIKRIKASRDKFERQIKKKAENMRNKIFEEVDNKLNEQTAHYESLKSQLDRKADFKAEKDAHIASVRNAAEQLKKEAENYGLKF